MDDAAPTTAPDCSVLGCVAVPASQPGWFTGGVTVDETCLSSVINVSLRYTCVAHLHVHPGTLPGARDHSA